MIMSRRIRWSGHVVHMERKEMHTEFWWGSQKERVHHDDLYVGGRITLRWILEKLTRSIWLRIGTSGRLL
jgi:hypothetical protein